MTNKVMIVEDDNDIRKHLIEALEMEDYSVCSAENGKKAFELLDSLSDEQLPKCIILDLMMPEMDGMTFLTEMSKHQREAYKNIKVIVATAKGSTDNHEALPITVERIQKPMDLDELYQRVKNHC